MSRKHKHQSTPQNRPPDAASKPNAPDAAAPDSADANSGAAKSDAPESNTKVAVGQWRNGAAPFDGHFQDRAAADVPLRVASERAAYAEVVAHAKESLDAEICGVLVGTECRDDEGLFVHVEAAVRGTRAQEGTAHVTYTQETWNAIYQAIDRDYPKLQIVGWYHSHPGFGVEFSDMDIFIQKNFFSGPTQLGLVTDPLGGDTALCANADDGIRYLDRFWVDGREQKCRVPASRTGEPASGAGGATSATIQSLETRVTQLVQTMDEMRSSFYRWLTGVGMLAASVIVFFVVWLVVQTLYPRIAEPPKEMSFQWIPVTIEGQPSFVGIQFVKWRLPPEMVTAFTKLEEEKKAAEEAKKAEDAKKIEDAKKAAADKKPGPKPSAAPSANPATTGK